jgi:CheY-specific phosphatase CheX
VLLSVPIGVLGALVGILLFRLSLDGAIDMARVLLKYGQDERLKRLAQSIIVEQGQEITYMRTLLDAPPNESTPRTADQ